MTHEFRPRFPLSEVAFWAARYSCADDAEVEAMGDRARERGWYTLDEFLTVAGWKSPRAKRRCEETEESVKAATQLALSTRDERQRIEALMQLDGVQVPTASVLLHLAHRHPYPIIDFRALWSLGWESSPVAYSFLVWSWYTEACRSLAKDAGVPMRTLDRALWQFSKERQPPTGTSAVDPGGASEASSPGEVVASESALMLRRMYAEVPTVIEEARYPNVDDLHVEGWPRYYALDGVHATLYFRVSSGGRVDTWDRRARKWDHVIWPGARIGLLDETHGGDAFPVKLEDIVAVGPVEDAIRTRFTRVPETLHTIDQGKPFVLSAIDGDGIVLLLGEGKWPTPLSWECVESVVPFLRRRAGCVRVGGAHSSAGEPGTLDEHLKRWVKRDVARWLVVVLREAGGVRVCQVRPLDVCLTERPEWIVQP